MKQVDAFAGTANEHVLLWPEAKSILEAWLDDANFDAGGRALQSLGGMMSQRSPSTRV